jgi:UDPglucose 6-dehydrogenase
MGADEWIGRHFLAPGPGWGGSCLPKDTAALVHAGRAHNVALREVESARRTNFAQAERIATTLRRLLHREGAQVTAYDPRIDSIDSTELPVAIARDPYVAAKDADAILVLTEWTEFSELDWDSIARCAAGGAVVPDTRNILDRDAVSTSALVCLGNGTAQGY